MDSDSRPAGRLTSIQDRPRSPLERAARGGALNLVGAAVAALANFALTVAVARGMDLATAGVLFTVTSVFLIVTSLGRLGTDSGLVYFLSRCRALETPNLIKSYVRAAMGPVVVAGVLLAVATFVSAPALARHISVEHVDLATTYLRALAVLTPFATIEFALLSASRGLGTMRPTVAVEQFGRPLLQLLLVIVVIAMPAVSMVAWAWAFAYLPACIASLVWWKKLSNRYSSLTTKHAGTTRQFWWFSGPRGLANVAQLAMQRLDIVLVAAIAGAASAAVYAATTRFVVVGQMARQAVSMAVQPLMAESLARRDHKGTNRLYQVTTAWLICVTWPPYLIFVVAGAPLLQVFGKSYATGALILTLVSLAMLIATACGDVDIVLIMAGRTSWSLANVTLAFTVNLGLDLWLIPIHGAVGAAIGWAVAIVTKNLAALIQVGIVLRLHPLGRATATAVVASLGCFALVPVLSRVAFGTGPISVLIGVAVAVLLYGGVLWTQRGSLQLGALRALRRGSATVGR